MFESETMVLSNFSDVILAASVSFVISGLGGAALHRFLSRARPILSVTGVGFRGDAIHLSSEAIEASFQDNWGPTLNGVVSFEVISKREQFASQMVLELQVVKELVDRWLRERMGDSDTTCLSTGELRKCPFFSYSIIGNSIDGMLRQRSFPDLPLGEAELQSDDRRYPLDEDDDELVLHMGNQGIRFPFKKEFSSKEIGQQKLIADSFSKGRSKNIAFILKEFSRDAAEEINKLTRLQHELRSALSQQSRVTLHLAITNLGATPFVVKPYFVGTFAFGNAAEKLIMVLSQNRDHVEQRNPGASLISALTGKDSQPRDTGKMFDVEPYLAKESSSPYMSIPAGTSVDLTVVSLKPMEKLGEKLLKFYDLGALECSVLGETAGGKNIRTPVAMLGKTLSDQQELHLLKQR